jgi:hypothetical protein
MTRVTIFWARLTTMNWEQGKDRQTKESAEKRGRRRKEERTSASARTVVLGRVNDSSESDSSLLAFFEGEREDSMTRVRLFGRVMSRWEEKGPKSA